jgi:alcohol dehydrogenase class IV
MPQRLTADTGIDALTHAIEAYVSRRATPFSDTMAIAAMRTIWPNLPLAYADPGNRAAREGMMFGATQAGIAFSNASVALVHGMSRPIGAHFHVAHGLSNAMLLPTVTAWSVPGAQTRYAECARIMSIAGDAEGDQSAAARLVDALRQLNKALTVPSPKSYGLDEIRWNNLLTLMAAQELESGSHANKPRVPDQETIEQLYRTAWN